jgi:4-amino-4-deoxy-L-arabinose transferase-like glycosyltransferase
MFVFFSLSAGKRAVYLLPIYPALALLLAVWFQQQVESRGIRAWFFRLIAGFAALTGALLILIALGDLWSRDPGWFFAPIQRLLKAKDRANFLMIKNQLADFGWKFDAASLLSALLWFSIAYCLWRDRFRAAAQQFVLLAVVFSYLSRGLIVPEIAAPKSYREFMVEVNRLVSPGQKLLVYGGFNSDPVFFYRGNSLAIDETPLELVAPNIAAGSGFVIMTEQSWTAIHNLNANLPTPLVRSVGKGPEGDAPLVLLQAEIG